MKTEHLTEPKWGSTVHCLISPCLLVPLAEGTVLSYQVQCSDIRGGQIWDSMWPQQRTTPPRLLEQATALCGYRLGMEQDFPRVAFHRRQAARF